MAFLCASHESPENGRVNRNFDLSIFHDALEGLAITFELREILIAQMFGQLFGRFIQRSLVCLPIDHVQRSILHPDQEIDHSFVPILGRLRPREREFGLKPEGTAA